MLIMIEFFIKKDMFFISLVWLKINYFIIIFYFIMVFIVVVCMYILWFLYKEF